MGISRQSTNPTMKTFTLLIALNALLSAGSVTGHTYHRRPTSLCICENPFFGTVNRHVGDPEITCAESNFCYVPCDADCRDLQPARGRGRCYSELACNINVPFKVDGQQG